MPTPRAKRSPVDGAPLRRAPRWVPWVGSFAVAAAFLAALVLFVNHEDATANQPARPISPKALAEENREDRIVVRQDEAPHVVRLDGATTPLAAARAAVLEFMHEQVRSASIDGPVERSSCRPAAGSSPARRTFTCSVTAASVNYPFDAVVVPGTRQITFCKHDLPPVPSMNIPVSRRCT